jgi:ferredoxin
VGRKSLECARERASERSAHPGPVRFVPQARRRGDPGFRARVSQLTGGTCHLDLEAVLAEDSHAVAFFLGQGQRGERVPDDPVPTDFDRQDVSDALETAGYEPKRHALPVGGRHPLPDGSSAPAPRLSCAPRIASRGRAPRGTMAEVGRRVAASPRVPCEDARDMPTVRFGDTSVECPLGANLRMVLLRARLPLYTRVARAIHCRGHGTCGTCAVRIEGPVSDPTAAELRRLRLPPHSPGAGLRLACQCSVLGDITVTKLRGLWGQRVETPGA